MASVHLIRTRINNNNVWIAFDARNQITGRLSETRAQLLLRWIETHGKFAEIIRYQGIARHSEAIATIVSVQE